MANPLTLAKKQPDHPAMMHARAWGQVKQMHPDERSATGPRIDATLPILGGLANNPKVTAKMVIKAAANAAADGQIEPSQAVAFISSMPTEPDKLQPWLKSLYAANLSLSVHLKAEQMAGAQPTPQAAPQAPPQAPQPAAPIQQGAPVNPLAAA